jgi:hypothetical protein
VTRQRFIVAAGVIGLVVLTVVLFFSTLATVRTATIDSFQRTGDPRKIVVNVTIGLGTEIAERSVREDANAVAVTVNVRQNPGSYPALALWVPVLVSLKEPLSDRAVLDSTGRAVRDVGGVYMPAGTTPKP